MYLPYNVFDVFSTVQVLTIYIYIYITSANYNMFYVYMLTFVFLFFNQSMFNYILNYLYSCLRDYVHCSLQCLSV